MDSSLVGYYRLVHQMVMICFERPFTNNKQNPQITKNARVHFANSNLLRAWCDISELDFKKVSNKIIDSNQ